MATGDALGEQDEIETSSFAPRESVMRLLRTLYDTSGHPLQVSDQRLAADKYVLVYDLPTTLTERPFRRTPPC